MSEAATKIELKERVQSTRPSTSEEKRFAHRYTWSERFFAKASLGISLMLFPLFFYLGVSEGEFSMIVAGGALSFLLAAALGFVFRKSYSLAVPDGGEVVRIQGRYSVIDKIKPTGGHKAHFIGRQEVRIPSHWTGFFSKESMVSAEVIPTTDLPILVATENGPSIEQESKSDLYNLIDQHINPGRVLLLVPATCCAVALIGFLLFALSGNGVADLKLSLENPVLLVSVVGSVVFSVPCGYFLFRHVKARRRIYQMYHTADKESDVSQYERRVFRLQNAAYVAVLSSVIGGGGMMYFLGTDPLWSILVFGFLGAVFGGFLEEPNQEAG